MDSTAEVDNGVPGSLRIGRIGSSEGEASQGQNRRRSSVFAVCLR